MKKMERKEKAAMRDFMVDSSILSGVRLKDDEAKELAEYCSTLMSGMV